MNLSDPAPLESASDSPASRKLPEPTETALAALVRAAFQSHGVNDPDVRAALDGVRAAVLPSLLPAEITPAIAEILGMPNFVACPYAHLFRAAGADIKRRSQDEQAHVLFWLLHLVLQRGDDWQAGADADIAAARALVKAKQAPAGAAP